MNESSTDALIDNDLNCSDAVRALLEKGVDFYVEASINNDYAIGPQFFRLRLTVDFLVNAQRKINDCVTAGFTEAKLPGSPDECDPGGNVQIHEWSMCVDKSSFWCRGETDGGNACTSTWLTIPYLLGALQAVSDKKLDDESLAWYGNCLFHHESDIDDFMDNVLEVHPEIEAAETALSMDAVIEANSSPPPTSRARASKLV